MKEKPAGKPGKKPGTSRAGSGSAGAAKRSSSRPQADERRPSASSPAGNAARSGKRPRISPASPGNFQSRIRPENRGKESTARMEAEEKRKAGFSDGKPAGKPGDRPGRPAAGRSFAPKTGGSGRPSSGARSFGNGGRREERQQDGERKPFQKGPRTFGDRERTSSADKKPGKISPAKNRLGTQAPEQVKEFRRKGNARPEYDEQKLAGMAPARGRRPVKRKTEDETRDGQLVRLNRFIAQSGLCSRREADDLISTGQITVNGKVMDQMGYLVKTDDVVKYGRRLLNKEKLMYVLLNKPKDFLTTTEDPEERKTVMALVENACKERIYPVGRLDRNTTGLLLLTNDGELSERLMHPSHNIRKIYQVDLDKPLTAADEAAVREGVVLEDGKAPVDELEVLSKERDIVGLSIHIGRNRIVRRIFESLGYKVVRLDRVMYAGLTKKDLPRGTWRYLTEKEVINLKYFS